MNDFSYIKYNRTLKTRYNQHDAIDAISCKDIDDNNKWLIRRKGDEDPYEDVQDDFIFDDDDLTWVELLELQEVRKVSLILKLEQTQALYQC